MSYSEYFRSGLFALCLLLFSQIAVSAPLSGPAASNETNAYGEDIFPDNDITSDESSESEMLEQYESARMAFLFGQYRLAFAGWEPLANEGYSRAQATLAWMYHTGKGVKKNLRTAHYWYSRASNQSHVIATNNLGVFYEQGLGVRENLRLAAENYLNAAQSGYSFAQYNIGMLFHDGRGVKKNQKEAIFWLQIAALQGVSQAQDVLESMGRKVTIPQHKKLNKHLKSKSNRPKWHKSKLQATVSSHRKEKTEDIYESQRDKLTQAAKKANKPKNPNKRTKDTAKKRSPNQKLLAKNRALVSKKAATIGKKQKSRDKTKNTSKPKPRKIASLSTSKTQAAKVVPSKAIRHKTIRNKVIPNKTISKKSTSKNPISKNQNAPRKKSLKIQSGSWVRKQNPREFTLQIAGSDNLTKIKSLATLLKNKKKTAYYRSKLKGKNWYSLVYGVYGSRSAAQKKIRNLPREFNQWSPWIRRFSDVQSKMK